MQNKPNFIPKTWPVQPDTYRQTFNCWNAVFQLDDGREYHLMIEADPETDYTEGRELVILRPDEDCRTVVAPGFRSIRAAYYHLIKLFGGNIPLPF